MNFLKLNGNVLSMIDATKFTASKQALLVCCSNRPHNTIDVAILCTCMLTTVVE